MYRGAHTPIRRASSPSSTDYDAFYLAPPRLEKNFLISPPGSPPVGWAPVKEDPPNAAPLAADLIAALTRLQMAEAEPTSGVEIVYDGGITVSVVDVDEPQEEEEEWQRPGFSDAGERVRFAPTALPPMRSH